MAGNFGDVFKVSAARYFHLPNDTSLFGLNLPTVSIEISYMQVNVRRTSRRTILLMEEVLHHLGCIKPCKYGVFGLKNPKPEKPLKMLKVHHIFQMSP